jgi:hypothetical protein
VRFVQPLDALHELVQQRRRLLAPRAQPQPAAVSLAVQGLVQLRGGAGAGVVERQAVAPVHRLVAGEVPQLRQDRARDGRGQERKHPGRRGFRPGAGVPAVGDAAGDGLAAGEQVRCDVLRGIGVAIVPPMRKADAALLHQLQQHPLVGLGERPAVRAGPAP